MFDGAGDRCGWYTIDVEEWIGKDKYGSEKGVFLPDRSLKPGEPDRSPKPGETWCMVEGVKDAAALVGLGYNAAGTDGSHLPATHSDGKLFTGVNVVLVPDLDVAGQKGAQRNQKILASVAASVTFAKLPGKITKSDGNDVRDVIRIESEQAVRDAIDAANDKPAEYETRGGIILIEDVCFYADYVKQVVSRLGGLAWDDGQKFKSEVERENTRVYQRAGVLVDVVTTPKEGAASRNERVKFSEGSTRIRKLPACQLFTRITQACDLEKPEGEKTKSISPPKWLLDAVHTFGAYGEAVRPLQGIITAPTILPDGSVLQTAGYDPSGLLFRPSMKFEPIPETPSKEDAVNAAIKLVEVVGDFPFSAEADQTAWLSMLLSMIGRPCVTGNVPLFALTANVRGAGKSMLVDVASIIAYGHGAARAVYTPNDDEMRKRITSVVMEGAPAVLLDNLDRPIGGASLDAVLTAERWTDRELGSSRMIDLPARVVWSATGNNLRFGSDIARRVLPVRLDSPLERPENRSGFRHSDLLQWTRENRAALVTAALTILRAYFVADCPKQAGGQFGSFESWSEIIRGSLVWAGLPDPMATTETARADDQSSETVAGLVAGLLEVDTEGNGLTCREIVDQLNDPHQTSCFPTLRDVVAEVASKNGKPDAARLGYVLRKYRGRVCDGFRIEQKTGRARARNWQAIPIKRGKK